MADAGAVLVFKPYGAMNHGHVAVVSQVLTDRIIQVTHANWSPISGRRGQVEKDVTVVDVSDKGDWSQVKVWYDPSGDLGRTDEGLEATRFAYGLNQIEETTYPAAGAVSREEIEAHVAMRAEHDHVDEAAARRRLGNTLQTREAMRRVGTAQPDLLVNGTLGTPNAVSIPVGGTSLNIGNELRADFSGDLRHVREHALLFLESVAVDLQVIIFAKEFPVHARGLPCRLEIALHDRPPLPAAFGQAIRQHLAGRLRPDHHHVEQVPAVAQEVAERARDRHER